MHYTYRKAATKLEASGKKITKNEVASSEGTFTNSCNCFSFDLISFGVIPESYDYL